MTPREFIRILRSQWRVIAAAALLATLCALAYALFLPSKYQATAQIFVATTSRNNNTQSNDGSMFAQRRVTSYTKLLTGDVLAQRTIDKLGLHMTPAQLRGKIVVTAESETVLIDVTATDTSPERARDIANTLADEFVGVATELETPDPAFAPNVRIIVQQRASALHVPVASKKAMLAIAGLMMGAFGGVALAVIRDRLDGSVKHADEIDRATGAGILGEVPLDPQSGELPLNYFAGDHSTTADAFRELAIRLRPPAPAVPDGIPEAAHRVLLVASPRPEEGRTTTAVNLAVALAEAGYRVVVVDADLRRPRVADALGVAGQVGLSTVLSGDSTLEAAVQKTRVPQLDVLISGAIPPNPTELLGSRATRDSLRELRESYDYVIVDSPPMIAADAAILAGSAQGLLMIVRYGRTKRKQLARAATTLKRTETPLLGSVLTMKPVKKDKKASSD